MQLITEAELLALSPAMLAFIRAECGDIDTWTTEELAEQVNRRLKWNAERRQQERNQAMRNARRSFKDGEKTACLWQLDHAAKRAPLTTAQQRGADMMRKAIAAREREKC